MSKIRWGDFVRQPIGTVEMIEVSLDERTKLSNLIQSYANYADAKISVTLVNGFNMKHEPVYILRAEVVQAGAPKKVGGRPKRSTDEESEG